MTTALIIFFAALAVLYFFLRRATNKHNIIRYNDRVEIYSTKTGKLITSYKVN